VNGYFDQKDDVDPKLADEILDQPIQRPLVDVPEQECCHQSPAAPGFRFASLARA